MLTLLGLSLASPQSRRTGHDKVFVLEVDREVEAPFVCEAKLPPMFDGSETLMEARQIFSSARLVIGPHGAGLVNVAFCQKWTPVIEFLSVEVADRPWLMWGGHSVGLPWWPLVVESLANSDEILDLGLQTAKLALAHAAR